jgi:hypothetical protein
MSLITRQQKGSKLTIPEMDGNLLYLESNGFVNGQYSQTLEGTGEIIEIGNLTYEPSSFLNAAEDTYEVTPTGGSGTGAIFNLVVKLGRFGEFSIDFDQSTIVSGGSGYEVGDILEVNRLDLGGEDPLIIKISLGEGSVNVTQTSEIVVSADGIVLSTPQTTNIFSNLSVTGAITADSISAQGIEGAANLTGLSVTGSPTSIIVLNNLPTEDPEVLGQLWADPAKGYVLIVSQGPL